MFIRLFNILVVSVRSHWYNQYLYQVLAESFKNSAPIIGQKTSFLACTGCLESNLSTLVSVWLQTIKNWSWGSLSWTPSINEGSHKAQDQQLSIHGLGCSAWRSTIFFFIWVVNKPRCLNRLNSASDPLNSRRYMDSVVVLYDGKRRSRWFKDLLTMIMIINLTNNSFWTSFFVEQSSLVMQKINDFRIRIVNSKSMFGLQSMLLHCIYIIDIYSVHTCMSVLQRSMAVECIMVLIIMWKAWRNLWKQATIQDIA